MAAVVACTNNLHRIITNRSTCGNNNITWGHRNRHRITPPITTHTITTITRARHRRRHHHTTVVVLVRVVDKLNHIAAAAWPIILVCNNMPNICIIYNRRHRDRYKRNSRLLLLHQ
jgi:hypothetical protein